MKRFAIVVMVLAGACAERLPHADWPAECASGYFDALRGQPVSAVEAFDIPRGLRPVIEPVGGPFSGETGPGVLSVYVSETGIIQSAVCSLSI